MCCNCMTNGMGSDFSCKTTLCKIFIKFSVCSTLISALVCCFSSASADAAECTEPPLWPCLEFWPAKLPPKFWLCCDAKLPNFKPDTKIEFKEILAYGDEKVIEIGAPIIEGAKVEANLLKNSKNRTILIFKKRRRQNSRRKNGHRQQYSMIKINKIFSKDGKVLSEAEKVSKTSKKEVVEKKTSK